MRCPLLDFMVPILEIMRSACLTAKDDLQEALRAQLEAAVANPLPSTPDSRMEAEAAMIGNKDAQLRSFLLDPQRTQTTFHTCNEGRKRISGELQCSPYCSASG